MKNGILNRNYPFIELNKDCYATYNNNNLTTDAFTNNKNEIIIPSKDLEISSLSPLFKNKQNVQKLVEMMNNNRQEKDFWEIEKQAEQTIKDEEEREQLITGIIIISCGLAILSLIVGSIMGFLYYFKIILQNTPDIVELNVQAESENVTNPSNQRAILRFIE